MENPNQIKYKYTVGMLIYHRTQELVDMAKDCLDSILSSSNRKDIEITLVDNGSTIRSDYWEKNVDTYVRFEKNMGISRGWNTILKLARSNYIAIVGDDAVVRSGWLEAMQEGMDMPLAGTCNPHVQNLPTGMGIVENYKWPSGSCFMLTPEVIKKVGYFAEEDYYPCNYEDVDYFLRIYKAGLKIYTNFNLTIQHLEGQTLHAPDLAAKNEDVRQAFLKKWNLDPIPLFYGDGIMPTF